MSTSPLCFLMLLIWRSSAVLLACLVSSAAIACPAGESCAQYNAPHTVSQATARHDFDAWRSLADAGIDCTGKNDATSALQAAINAAPDHSTLIAPVGCQIKISSTILIQGRADLNLMSLQHPLDVSFGRNNPPQIIWNGNGAGPWINMIDDTAVNIQGFMFSTSKINT